MIKNINDETRFIKDVEKIFFESSTVKDFKTDTEKAKFLYKYLGMYHKNCPEMFFVYVEDEKVLGYICGVKESLKQEILDLQTHLNFFIPEIKKFPSHLHINLAPHARGRKIGTQLIEHFCFELNTCGVHIITSKLSKNVNFYARNNFNFQKENTIERGSMLFMGRNLSR